MMRCFDVPVVPSAIAAQLCIFLFAPALLLVTMPTVFCLTPGNAVVYAPHLIALGLLARIEPGQWRNVVLITAGIFAMLFYSFYVDPLWTAISGFSWAVAFAIVTLAPLRLKPILVRGAALGSFVVLLFASGAASYMHTLSQYTVRVQYPALVDRARSFWLVSALSYPANPAGMRYFYAACILGWLVGLVTLRARARLLVIAATVSFIVWLAYSVVYLVLENAVWIPPIPSYVEHSLVVLYLAAAVAGYWGVLPAAVSMTKRGWPLPNRDPGSPVWEFPASAFSRLFGVSAENRSLPVRFAMLAIAVFFIAFVPAKVIAYAVRDSRPWAEVYHLPRA